MSVVKDKPAHMYGITRVDDDKYRKHSWRVSLSRHGKTLVKNFSDKKCGGKDSALLKAMLHRDGLVKKNPPLSRKEYCDLKRRNNKTGITGVYTYAKSYPLSDGTIRENWYWEANWPITEGESASQSFSVKRYGNELAKQMAIRARNKGLEHVRGTYWAAKKVTLKM